MTAPVAAPAAPAAPSAPVQPAEAAPTPETLTLHDMQRMSASEVAKLYGTPPEAPAAAEPVAEPEPGAEPEPEPEPTPEGAEPEPTQTFAVEMPLPQRGDAPAGKLALELPSQEAADTLRHHLKQSARAERLAAVVEQGNGDTATVDFLEQHPTEGLLWMAEQHPEAGAKFLDLYIRANWQTALETIQALGFKVEADTATQRALDAEQRLAKQTALQAVINGRSQFQQGFAQQAFTASAREVVGDVASALGLTPQSEEYQFFVTRCSPKLAEVYQAKGRSATSGDMVAAIQPVVDAFQKLLTPAAAPVKVHHSQQQPRQPAGQRDGGQFTDAQKAEALRLKNERLRKLAGPTPQTAAALASPAKPTDTLYDAHPGRKPYTPH